MQSDEVPVIPRATSDPQIYERFRFCAWLSALRAFRTVCLKSNSESHVKLPAVLWVELGNYEWRVL